MDIEEFHIELVDSRIWKGVNVLGGENKDMYKYSECQQTRSGYQFIIE